MYFEDNIKEMDEIHSVSVWKNTATSFSTAHFTIDLHQKVEGDVTPPNIPASLS